MNYINSFSIAGSTYVCTPLKADSSYNWGTYNANLYPSIASYNTNYTRIISNDVLDGTILYSARIIAAGSDTKYSGGNVYSPYDVYTYEPDHVDFSVQSNFILNGSVSIWAYPTSSILLSQEVVQGYVSKHISYSNSIIFNDNIIVNCDTTNISIPALFNDSCSEAYTVSNNALINTAFVLPSSYANKNTIIDGSITKLFTGVPPTVTEAASSYKYLSTSATFIGGGELTANTDFHNIFIGGNNFYYSVDVETISESATVVEDIGFVISNETGSTEYPSSDVSIVYVSSYTDSSHYRLGAKSGYYYSSFTDHNLPQYRKLSGYHFDGYYDNSGNMCSALSNSYYCIKPTLYDISIELLDFRYPCYFTWQGGIGYGTQPGDTWSVITPPSIAESRPVTFRSICHTNSIYIEMGSEYDAWGNYATMGLATYPEGQYYLPLIGFATRRRPVGYLFHYDSYYSSSFIDSQGNSVWHWLFSRSYERNGLVDSLSFHYTELPKLVITTPYTPHNYRLHIHKITTNKYEI